MKTNLILFIILCVYAYDIRCQTPSYDRIGGDFFSETDIYSLIQDKDENIWIGTNEGLFKYNGYDIVKYTNSELKKNEIFDLTLDNNEQIFCHNLNGEVLYIHNDSLQVYYQIPDSLISNFYSIGFDNYNQLFISSEHFFLVDSTKNVKIVYDLDYTNSVSRTCRIKRNAKRELRFFFDAQNILATYYEGKLTKDKNHKFFDPVIKQRYHLFINRQGKEVVVLNQQGVAYKNEKTHWERISIDEKSEKRIEGSDFYLSDKGEMWFFSTQQGAYVLDLDGKPLYGGKKIFSKYRISASWEDKEGNLWLGTFQKGLIFIPNRDLIGFQDNSILKEEELKNILIGEDNSFFVANKYGGFFQIDSNYSVRKIAEVETSTNDRIAYFEQEKMFYFNDLYLYWETGEQKGRISYSIKDICKIDDKEFLIATNIGVYYINRTDSSKTVADLLGGGSNVLLNIGRTNCVYFDSIHQHIWAGTTGGLYLVDKDSIQKVKITQEQIVANSITSVEGAVYIATNQGVLVFRAGVFVKKMTTKDGLLSDDIRLIKSSNESLYIASQSGFQRYSFSDNKFQNFELSDGLYSNSIFDFEIIKNKVALSTSKGVQIVDFEKINPLPKDFIIALVKVKVNDENITIQSIELKHDQNKIEFDFIAKSYRNKKTIIYQYRLKGAGDDWNSLTDGLSNVRYNSLPSGDYVFELKATDGKGNHSNLISFDFRIAFPFWQTGWFLLLSVVIIGGIVAIIFIVRIRVLKKENALLLEKENIKKELIESRQAVLRSQMNPHFLFNTLNSIQELIMVNEKKMAINYLADFADLMRMYLAQSQKKNIQLSEEIRALKLYLGLEKNRFEDTLTIDWYIDPKLDLEFIRLPPMIIQSYVENSIKHGLLHKAKDRILAIRFYLSKEEDQLYCEVEDNGIGRKKAMAINKIRNPNHASFATSATQKRLELLNLQLEKPIKLEIYDLIDQNQEAIGTKIVLILPLNS